MSVSKGPDLKVRENLEKILISSNRATRISFAISIIAIAAACFSVFLAYKDSESDALWKKDQIQTLNEAVGELRELNKNLGSNDSLNKEQINVLNEVLGKLSNLEKDNKGISSHIKQE